MDTNGESIIGATVLVKELHVVQPPTLTVVLPSMLPKVMNWNSAMSVT